MSETCEQTGGDMGLEYGGRNECVESHKQVRQGTAQPRRMCAWEKESGDSSRTGQYLGRFANSTDEQQPFCS